MTPVLNGAHLVEDTVKSVFAQTAVADGSASVEYILADGGSDDTTVDLALAAAPKGQLDVRSEKDRGMYDAVRRGFEGSTADVHCYLNAGDTYNPHAFALVQMMILRFHAEWITGFTVLYADDGSTFHVRLPFRYRSELFKYGVYGTILPNVQQESTFWLRSIEHAVDWEVFSQFRLAGDAYLWNRFSTLSTLKIVGAHLGGFRYHDGQLSSDRSRYDAEMDRFSDRIPLTARVQAALDRIGWELPRKLKKAFNPHDLVLYSTKEWR